MRLIYLCLIQHLSNLMKEYLMVINMMMDTVQ